VTLRLHVFDVETTGLKPEEGDRVVEVAVVPLSIFGGGSVIGRTDGARSFVNPGDPFRLTPAASITSSMRMSKTRLTWMPLST
jgi:DNA polymerase III epsilon subunit-like protein